MSTAVLSTAGRSLGLGPNIGRSLWRLQQLSVPTCAHYSSSVSLPQHTDLLERYRGLVVLGKIQYDEDQVRVIMQLRRLQKELDGYAPPALSSRYLELARYNPTRGSDDNEAEPWWSASGNISLEPTADQQALVRIRTHAEEIASLNTPKGLLLTGPPGSGKSFMIDMWLAAIPTPYKARKHYSELVLEIYRAVWQETRIRMRSASTISGGEDDEDENTGWSRAVRDRWRKLLQSGDLPTRWMRGASGRLYANQPTIPFVVAQRLILHHWLLVFDEIQLLDVSSATLLADVLSWFWRMGGVIVGSSNKVPDDLYKNGVQKERLEPFVEALKVRCPIVEVQAQRDWRVARAERSSTSSWYLTGQEHDFEDKLRTLTGGDQDTSRSRQLVVFGRSITVPWSKGGVCRFTFTQLCDESLGPADYMTLASTYQTVAITDIPVLKLTAKNQARRFISLIDALYEARCRIICLAESPPESLFFPDTPSVLADETNPSVSDMDVMMAEAVAETQDVYRPNVSSYDSPTMAEAPQAPASALALDTLSIFSGKDEQFAFKRALSRLLEITSESYAAEERWAPLPPSSRKWEGSSLSRSPPPGSTPRIPAPIPSHQHQHQSGSERSVRWTAATSTAPPEGRSDVASEAAHQGAAAARPAAPRLHEAHVWGVREDWGERAKAWGRGARAYENTDAPTNLPAGSERTSAAPAPGRK